MVSVVIVFEVVDPTVAGVTVPMPWSIEKVLAFVVAHESVVCSPEETALGLAESVQVGAVGGGGGVVVTVMVAEQCTVPPEPVAVPVYVVSEVGDTEANPVATSVTTPTLWSMEKAFAPVVVHKSLAWLPTVTEVGLAESVQVGAAGGGWIVVTVTVAEQCTKPPGPFAVSV